MKRLHVHVAVEDIDGSVPFYVTLFGAEPSVREADYAKWMLDDPRVNFAISARGAAVGVDHLGIQVEAEEELAAIAGRLADAGRSVLREERTACCYAVSDKAWVTDPAGISWEAFLTHGSATVYGDERTRMPAAACCGSTLCGTDSAVTAAPATACCSASSQIAG